MGKVFETQTYLRIKLSYTADVASNVSSMVIKYKDPDGTVDEWTATHVPASKYAYYDLVAGSPLAKKGRWHFWLYAVMNDTRILVGEVKDTFIYAEGTDKQ